MPSSVAVGWVSGYIGRLWVPVDYGALGVGPPRIISGKFTMVKMKVLLEFSKARGSVVILILIMVDD